MPDKGVRGQFQPLTNSQRRLYKATYRPLTVPPSEGQETGRFLEKLAFLRGLNILPQEFVRLERSQAEQVQPSLLATRVPLIDAMQQLTTDLSFAAMRRYGPLLADLSSEELIKVGNAVHRIRLTFAADVEEKLRDLQDRFQEAVTSTHPSSGAKERAVRVEISAEAAVAWAKAEGLPVYEERRNIAERLRFPYAAMSALAGHGKALTAISDAEISNLPQRLDQRATLTANLASAFQYQAQIEPVGQLHLERLEMTPAGIEHGELTHSVPLTPKETVNITHREWSVVTKTFETIVQDSFEGFSETGVAEKTDLSQSSDNEAKHSSALDVNGSVSASYNGGAYSVTASTAVDYRQQADTQQIEKDSIAHAVAITRNASTRTKKEHKMSFRVSSVAGAEDLSVRVITNPSDTNAMRVDYFQLLRKWRVDLIRYGLRMTYDLVIPNPGLDLVGRVLEIQAIDEMLTTTSYSFGLHVDDVTRDRWLVLSEQYGVELDPPPEMSLPIAFYKKLDPVKGMVDGDVEIDIPDEYEFENGTMTAVLHLHVTSGDPHPQWATFDGIFNASGSNYNVGHTSDLSPYQHTVGKLIIGYGYLNTDDGSVQVNGTCLVLLKAMQEWQLKSWTALRNADQAAYDKRVQQAKERKAFLQDQVAQFDALTLRKMEREEIMRWVLRWLLGPGFDLMPAYLMALFQAYPDPDPTKDPKPTQYAYKDVATLTKDEWLAVFNYGEFVKYIHDAIEWENVLFFAYPYFWDHVNNWPFKRFLVHPDPIHREFLRSGAMRIVLTIRPGFEESFAMLQQTGDSTAPPNESFPYVTIAEDIRNFAMTNYEGIPPANPDNNVRPLLYSEQRRAWNDMQKLIRLIEDYNDYKHKHNRTISNAITPTAPPTPQTVTPSSMEGIEYGTKLIVDTDASQETVIVSASTATTFTATFANSHLAGAAFQIDPAVKLYPSTSQFPAAIQSFAGNASLPLTDPWGHPYHYTAPGLNADYDLVCYGADGVAQKDQNDPKKLADPLNADITNYAEGSIVGRWYEYTPTGALDVSINTVLPTTPQPA